MAAQRLSDKFATVPEMRNAKLEMGEEKIWLSRNWRDFAISSGR